MKTYLETSALRSALKRIVRIASRRTTLPILNCLKLEAVDGLLHIHASDLKLFARVTVEAETVEPGVVVINAKLFDTLVNGASSDTISLVGKGGSPLTIEGGSKGKYPTVSADEWPNLEGFTPEVNATFDSAVIRNAIQTAGSFSHPYEVAEPTLSGVLLHLKPGGKATVIGTNRYCGAVLNITGTTDGEKQLLIPKKSVGDLPSLFPDGEVQFDASENLCRFTGAGMECTFRLSSYAYPPAEGAFQTMKSGCDVAAVFSPLSAQDAVGVIASISSTEKIDRMRLSSTGKAVVIAYERADPPTSHSATLDAKGGEFVLNLSARNVALVLSKCDGQDITVRASSSDPGAAAIFERTGLDGFFTCTQYRDVK